MYKLLKHLLIVLTVFTLGSTIACSQQQNEQWQRPFPVDKSHYPFQSHLYTWQNYKVHYIDEPAANGQTPRGTVLAVHGNAAWSFIYRKTVKPLNNQGFRVIAVDLLGFGFSDQPPASEFDYMASSQAKMLNDLIQDLKLENIYLMLQDWGGPIGLDVGTNMPDKITAILLMNTWAWELPAIPEGSTHFMHPVHDRGVDARRNPDFYINGKLAEIGGLGVAKRNAQAGSADYLAIRNAMWGPFLDLNPPHKPLSEEGTVPLHLFARATVDDAVFLRKLDQKMKLLHNKPVYFAFGDDTAFGPLKADRGMHQKRSPCPEGYHPENEPLGPRTNCVDSQGRKFWAVVERFRADWNPSQVVGLYEDVTRGHWIQDEVPEVAVQAIDSLQKFVAKHKK